MKNIPTAKIKNLVVQDLGKELLIYDLAGNKAYCLNESLALVWQYSDGQNSVTDISVLMGKKMKIKVSEEFVLLGLDQLKKEDLLENNPDFEINFNGSGRREVIKKIGFASMIALPVLLSVVAPTSAAAASCALFAPGTIYASGCFSSAADCNLNFGSQCCSGAATNIASPCPLFPPINACACV